MKNNAMCYIFSFFTDKDLFKLRLVNTTWNSYLKNYFDLKKCRIDQRSLKLSQEIVYLDKMYKLKEMESRIKAVVNYKCSSVLLEKCTKLIPDILIEIPFLRILMKVNLYY